jgi:hypothetical protein
MTCPDTIHWLCRKKAGHILALGFPQEQSTGSNGLPVENGCGQVTG